MPFPGLKSVSSFSTAKRFFEETVGFDVKASFPRPPVWRFMKPDDITNKF